MWSKHPSTDTGKEEAENNRKSTTYIRDGASFAVKCVSIAPLKEKEGVRAREIERQSEREENREMESAEGFESTAQIAHKVLNHACTVHTHMNINTFFLDPQ